MAHRNKLNDVAVRNLQRRGETCMEADGDGLYFRKQTASGDGTWVYRYKRREKSRLLTLGHYPAMSLAQARQETRQQQVLRDKRLDPVDERRKLESQADGRLTIKQVAEDWYQSDIARRLKHPKIVRRYIDKYILPGIGRLGVGEVAATDVLKTVEKLMQARRGPTAANDLLRYMQRMLNFAVRRRMIAANPASSLTQRDAGGPEKPRSRCLSEAEIAKLFAAIRKAPSFDARNLIAVRLLLALGVRKGELLAAKWAEFDLDGSDDRAPVWLLPAGRSKTGAAIDIPLPPSVTNDLRALKTLAGVSEYVFPRRRFDPRSRYQHVGLDTLNVALTKLAHGLKAFTVHDLRRTMRTQLAALGIAHEVAERCLNHKLRGVAGTYNTHE